MNVCGLSTSWVSGRRPGGGAAARAPVCRFARDATTVSLPAISVYLLAVLMGKCLGSLGYGTSAKAFPLQVPA